MSPTRFNSRWALPFLTSSPHVQTSLYFSWLPPPVCFLFMLEFRKEWLECTFAFFAHQDEPFLSSEKMILKTKQFFWTSLPSRIAFYTILLSSSLNRPNCPPEDQDCDPAFCLSPSSQNPELHHLVVAAAKAAPDFHIPEQFLLLCKHEVHQSTFPHWFLFLNYTVLSGWGQLGLCW